MTFETVKEYINESFEQRFEYNKLFNTKLEKMCLQNKFKYINFWPILFDEHGLKSKYIPDTVDHHLQKIRDDELLTYVLQIAHELTSKD